MAPPVIDVLKEFDALLAPHRSRWQVLELRIFAFREGELLRNLVTHAVLRFPHEDPALRSTIDLSGRLVAIVHHESAAAVGDVLAQIHDGVLKIGGARVVYRLESGPSPWFHLQKFRRGDRDEIDHPTFEPRPLVRLTATGPSFTDICGDARLNEAVWELRAAQPPYESVEDFYVGFLGLRPAAWGGFGDVSATFVTAPLGLGFSERSAIADGHVRAEILARGGPLAATVRIGVIAATPEGVVRDSIDVAPDRWGPTADGVAAEIDWTHSGAHRASLLLTIDDQALDVLRIADPSRSSVGTRLAAHVLVDSDLRSLDRLLAGKGARDAPDFEHAVAVLLHLCRLDVVLYGSAGPFNDGPDVVAFSGERPLVMVVECTLRDIDSQSKLTKLHVRRQQLAQALLGYDVIAAIFTPLTHAEIGDADLEKAEKLAIAVASAETIKALRALVVDGASPRDALEQLGFHTS